MNLKNKVVLITGASDGLGKAIAQRLSKEGARLALLARDGVKLEKIAKELGPRVISVTCDITKPEDIKKAVNQVVKHFGKINVLINCAGIWLKLKHLEEATSKEISDVIDVDLKGLIYTTKETLPYLKKSKEAYIVNISSRSGVKAKRLQAVYCAAKFGVKGFTDALKLELNEHDIKVVGFYPSGMNTKMFKKTGETFSSKGFMKVENIADIVCYIIQRSQNICIEEIWVDKFSDRKVNK